MSLFDVSRSVAHAQHLLSQGRAGEAVQMLRPLASAQPRHAGLHQTLGVALRRAGRTEEAIGFLAAASRLEPSNPALMNSLANALSDLGRSDEAISWYRRAVALAPGNADALVNLSLEQRKSGDLAAAEAFARSAVTKHPAHHPAWRALGLTLLARERLHEAAAAFDKVIALQPQDRIALTARANIEMDLGRPATRLYQAARAVAHDDEGLLLGHAAALHREGRGEEALDLLGRASAQHPEWRRALAASASLRWQWGAAESVTAPYEAALRARPGDEALWEDALTILSKTRRFSDAMTWLENARRALRQPDAFLAVEANALEELGMSDRAAAVFARMRTAGLRDTTAEIRHLLRARRCDQAAAACERRIAAGEVGMWPYLGTAWRLAGDPRYAWLDEQPNTIAVVELGLAAGEIASLAEFLRRLQVAPAAPLDQSIVGGRQTEGNLLMNEAPVIRTLRRALEDAVADHVRKLPEPITGHPTLDIRPGPPRIAAAWSVLLEPGGFHTAHTHPDGRISSALYVEAPLAGEESAAAGEDGYLVLGEPPRDLGLGLAPLRRVRPRPGRLVLFPSHVWHGTRPLPSGSRLSIAFDVAMDRPD